MADRVEGEERADVARRLDRPDEYPTGPTSYEIGSTDDPDRADED
jgi:GTP-binding protein